MQTIDNISNEAKQKHTILLDKDSSRITLELTYKPSVMGWFLDVAYEDNVFQTHGIRVTTNSNLLNQWRNILPFGIICQCADAQDPLLVDDFLVGRAKLSILSQEEIQNIVSWQAEIKDAIE